MPLISKVNSISPRTGSISPFGMIMADESNEAGRRSRNESDAPGSTNAVFMTRDYANRVIICEGWGINEERERERANETMNLK